MIHRARVLLVAVAAVLLAIPLLPGPGVFIIMAAVANVEEAFRRQSVSGRAVAGFPPAPAAAAGAKSFERLDERGARGGGRRVA